MLLKQNRRKGFLKSKILKEMQRDIVKNFLYIIVLVKLGNSRPLSGYDVIGFVHKKFDVLISSGTIYSLLYSIERKGLIKGESDNRRRVYTLTDKGAATVNTILNLKSEIQRLIGNCFSN
jgi:DNA-binding PadR family transcriptional regulator